MIAAPTPGRDHMLLETEGDDGGGHAERDRGGEPGGEGLAREECGGDADRERRGRPGARRARSARRCVENARMSIRAPSTTKKSGTKKPERDAR